MARAGSRVFGGFSLHGGKHHGGISSFQALATAVAAQVGTGNIVGACGAILIGGPGAIFWMWIIAMLGMATNYAEAVLAQKTRHVDEDGRVHGGPVYYIRTAFKGAGGKFLAGFFSVAIILALGFMGSMVQSNSIAATMNTAFGIPTWIMGLVVVLIGGFIFIGGVTRIAAVTEKLVPIMAVLYIVGSLVVLVMNWQNIIPAFELIFTCAFNPQASVGGVTFGIIAAMTQGAKRGLFSNEAGMGSTPHAHALANVKDPHDQGVVAMIGVFIDTIVVVTMTALVVISVLYVGDGPMTVDATGVAAASTRRTWPRPRSARSSERASAARSWRFACSSSRFRRSSAGTCSRVSTSSTCSARRASCRSSSSRSSSSSWARCSPTTSSGSWQTCSTSSWSSPTPSPCLPCPVPSHPAPRRTMAARRQRRASLQKKPRKRRKPSGIFPS